MAVKVKFDFADVPDFFDKGKSEVKAKTQAVGDEAVEYAKTYGSYQDRTGTLRKSNHAEASDEGLTLYNDATNEQGTTYASFVEAKGYDVLSRAALYAESELKKEFE